MKILQKSLLDCVIFNPGGDDSLEAREVWGGNPTNTMNFSLIKHEWALATYRQMRQNVWIPEKVDTTSDFNCYTDLTDQERKAYNGILSYLTFLDSIQVTNLPYLQAPISSPEIKICLAEQQSQEALHSHSYQVLIDSIIPNSERANIYDFWRTDPVLLSRCQTIAKYYQNFLENRTEENYLYALFADYLLEGLYFFTGFNYFYNLASRNLMLGTADMIKYIHRDELSHLRLFQALILEALKKFPYSEEQLFSVTDQAVKQECIWMDYITDDKILGISQSSTKAYTHHLANLRLKAVGLPTIYEEQEYHKDPYKHLARIADISNEAHNKVNFFEATVTSYNTSDVVDGWEF